jgi:AcrR family transcriptional regulator
MNNAGEKSDTRVATRTLIFTTFNRLMLESQSGRPRVAEIVAEAGVARSTFYDHFEGVEALFDESLSMLLGQVAQCLVGYRSQEDMVWLMEHIHDNRERGRDMLAGPGAQRTETLLARLLMRELEAQEASLSTEARDAIAEKLWTIALMVEEGNLQSALDRLKRAQDRLQEAIENGASQEEIDQLMKEMQQALNEYMRELAEEGQRNPEQQQSEQGQTMEFSADQLQQMLDKLQQLMEEGRTAEAAELRAYARQMCDDPRFAADLYAAADRHERTE